MLLQCKLVQGTKGLLSTQLSLHPAVLSSTLSVGIPQSCGQKVCEGFDALCSGNASYSAARRSPAAAAAATCSNHVLSSVSD